MAGANAAAEKGIGLGLSFVKEVVNLHGGKIWVQSELQKGSVFSIALPIGNRDQERGGRRRWRILQIINTPLTET